MVRTLLIFLLAMSLIPDIWPIFGVLVLGDLLWEGPPANPPPRPTKLTMFFFPNWPNSSKNILTHAHYLPFVD